MGQRARPLIARLRRQRGLALLSVLWVVMLLSLMAASFSVSTRTEVNLAFNQADSARAEALADAGVYRAIMGLMLADPDMAWRVDGRVYAWRYRGAELRAAVRDEGGKIDLNRGEQEMLHRLFVAAGLDDRDAAALTDAVADFRDEDKLRHANGAEDRDYEQAGLPYGAKDAPFESLEELRQVLGMSAPLFEAVAPSLTVYSRLPRPHEPTAPELVKEVLLAVGGTETDKARAEDDHEDVDEDEEDVEQAGLPQPFAEPEAPEVPEDLTDVPRYVGDPAFVPRSRARAFSVHVESRLDSGAVFARDAIVRMAGGGPLGFDFLVWRQGRRELFVEPPVADPPADE